MIRNILGICKDHLNYITMADCKHFRHEELEIQKEKQMSSLLLGGQNLFNSLLRKLLCTRTI